MVDKGHPPLPLNLQPGWDHERGAGSVHLGWYVEANRKVAVLSQEDSSGEEEQLLTWSSQGSLQGSRVVLRDWAGSVAGFRRKSER